MRTRPLAAIMAGMGKHEGHETKVEGDGKQPYDHAKTKPVEDTSGGTRSTDDKGDTRK